MNPLRHPWNSLHARLLIGAALWIAIALAASDVAISALFRQHVTSQFVHELTDHLSELQAIAHVGPCGSISMARPLSDPRFEVPGSGFYWQISRAEGPCFKSPSLGADSIRLRAGPAPLDPYITRLRLNSKPIMLTEWVVRDGPRPLRFSVGAGMEQLDSVVDRFTQLLRLSLGVIAVGLISAAVAQVALGLRPLKRLKKMLVEVRTGRSEHLPEDFPNEVRPLVAELNSLIETNQERVRRARAQAGNLAHALKGPLAILVDEAQRLSNAGNAAVGEVVMQQCVTMNRHIDYQLARARAAATRAGSGLRCSLPPIVGAIISAMARLYGDRQLVFENSLDPEINVACDPEDANEMIGNLVDNAAKWANSHVKIRNEPGKDGSVWIIVEDDGPGIDPESRATVFGIGRRLDEQKPGSGLGLAIVKDLLELYGGRVRLDRSPLGGLLAAIELELTR